MPATDPLFRPSTPPPAAPRLRILLLTALTMGAFAANSLLARAALLGKTIDPGSFSALRLAAGAVVLLALIKSRRTALGGTMRSAFWLALYAVPFSFSYVTLPTGTGALILFGCVQLSMLAYALISGERLTVLKWMGLLCASCGLIALLLPGIRAPDPAGAAAMAAAGLGWGMYTVSGRGSKNPLAETAGNFLRSVPIVLVAPLWSLWTHDFRMSGWGVALALLSGGVTSGLGYALWYSVLPHLSASTAAAVQLTVPLLATAFGVVALGETVSLRLFAASLLILGGVAVVIFAGSRAAAS